MAAQLNCGDRLLDLEQAVVMGILNLTPDSFSDGGELLAGDAVDLDALLRRAEGMVADGAALLDIGAESTRPGAMPVAVEVEVERIMLALEALTARLDVIVSIDSSTPQVFTAAATAGAGLLNDVRALQRPGALDAAAATGLPVCLMHMQGEPGTMQDAPHYEDVVAEVRDFLVARMSICTAAGIGPERLLVDPGFGFGKSLAHNVALLRELPRLGDLGAPVLVGLSRKRMLGALTGREAGERVAGGVAAAVLAVAGGARIVRTHDVRATVDALRVANAVLEI